MNEVSRELAWFLTGHGPFNLLLYRQGKSQTMNCELCGGIDVQTAIHLFMHCNVVARQIREPLGILTAEDVQRQLKEGTFWQNANLASRLIVQMLYKARTG